MPIRSLLFAVLCAGCAASGLQLTTLEKEKLDPALQRLVLGAPASRTEYDITPGPSGEDTFGVIVRSASIDDLRNAGYTVTSAFGDVAVVRVTISRLRTLVTLPSVQNVSNGSQNHPM
ncbi:MAG TPA: hypothetical protein VMF59_05785 [Bacteroidota bacterium]|nr:hypothetical protein [Bacteroidota bacterium]